MMNAYDWKLVETFGFFLGMVQFLIAVASWLVLKDTGIIVWSIAVLAFALYLSVFAAVKRVTERFKDEQMLKEAHIRHPPEEPYEGNEK